MAGKFQWCNFSDCDLKDNFFTTLMEDYEEFPSWFEKKSKAGEKALVFTDEQGIGAFVYLKIEIETIELVDRILPAIPRLKIGTMKLANRFQGQRLGEGALGVSLWRWQEEKCDEVYLTVFEKHSTLIAILENFGFKCIGMNKRGECIYLKSRKKLDYSDAYKSFPFINPDFQKAGLLPIQEQYHDSLFPYSELKGNKRNIEEETAGNGITKVYIASPATMMNYTSGSPVFIYRIYQGATGKTYKSCITSFATITKIEVIKSAGRCQVILADFLKKAGNKTIFTQQELTDFYNKKSNVVMLELAYNGYFGKGHNVIHKDLNDNELFYTYPYQIEYSKQQFINILEMGDTDVQNVIID